MNLKEFNESYDEYILTEEYLIEGLKIFKESNKLYKFATKINKKALKGKDPEAVKVAKKLADDVVKLADEYKVVEDAFAKKELDRRSATSKLNQLKTSNESLTAYVKSERTKSLLGKIGLGVLAGGLVVALGSVLLSPQVIASIGSAFAKGADAVKNALSKIGNFLTGKKAIPDPTAMERGAAAVGGAGSAHAGSKLGIEDAVRGSSRGSARAASKAGNFLPPVDKVEFGETPISSAGRAGSSMAGSKLGNSNATRRRR